MNGYESVEHHQQPHYGHENVAQNGEFEYEDYQPQQQQQHQQYNQPHDYYSHSTTNYQQPHHQYQHQRSYSHPNPSYYDYGYDGNYYYQQQQQSGSSNSSAYEANSPQQGYHNNYHHENRRYSNQYTYDNRSADGQYYDNRSANGQYYDNRSPNGQYHDNRSPNGQNHDNRSPNGQYYQNNNYYYDRRASTGQYDSSARSSARSSQNHSKVFSVSTQPTTITEPPGENERIVADQLNITSLKSLGLNDSRYIIETDFTWFIDNWDALVKDSTGLVLGPPVYIEGYYWNIRLYPNGEAPGTTTTAGDSKVGAKPVAMYLKARPKRSNCIDWPVSTEYTFTAWNPSDSDKYITKQLQNQTLSYTSTMNGFSEFETVSHLRQQGIISAQNQLNITVHLKFMKGSLYGR
ncbi:hypothetical protein TRVA0_016S01310 [Trichomonascus vanleenenianus]|uniref:MATH domain-containing protein n=1 Tax=Trichomonascus vanleenenianus TaxID=2268995 RepID=UPI003ECBAB33